MAELPYMQFFPTDWLSDCQVLSLAARGAWQTIICKAWHSTTRGTVSMKLEAWARTFGASVKETEKVIAEIEETRTGEVQRDGDMITITCRRTARDWETAVNRKSTLSEAGHKGAEKRWAGHSQAKGHPNGLANSPPIKRPMAIQKPEARNQKQEREGAADSPTWEAVKTYAANIGLAEWKARDWFDEMEGCGWIDYQHRPIVRWQSVLTRVKAKWDAEGRPAGPTSARSPKPPSTSTRVSSKWAQQIKPKDRQG